MQAWFEWIEEAFRYGVNPDVSRDELAALIAGSTVELKDEGHRASHPAIGDGGLLSVLCPERLG